MKLLLDTHLVLWSFSASERLSPRAKELMDHPAAELFFSVVSVWEIALKRSLGRPDFTTDPALVRRVFLEHGYIELPLTGDHALGVQALPPLHKDPFDRGLIAQATWEGITLLTADSLILQYPGPIMKV